MQALWHKDASKQIEYRFLSDCCDASIVQKRFRDQKLDILPFVIPTVKKKGKMSHSYYYRDFCSSCDKVCTSKLETKVLQ